jgi:ribonuclease HI
MEGFGGCLEPDVGVNVQGSCRDDGGLWDGCRDKGGLVAAMMAGLFCTSSEEEDFGRATNEEMEVGAATMAASRRRP